MDFAKLVRLILPNVVDGVLQSRRQSYGRLVEKLQELEFVTRSITHNPNDVTIELQVIDEDLLFFLFSGESNKFLLASLLSYERALQSQRGNAAWQAIEHYYAAYYAIHYLLRVTGVSLSNLDSIATDAIIRNQLGPAKINSIPGGLYVLRYDNSTKTIVLTKNLKSGAGGSHQDAWKLWLELIGKLQLTATSDPVEYARESLNLSTHKSFVLRSTGRYNPPELRGEINYQFKGGAWIFEQNASQSIRRLQAMIAETPLSSSNPTVPPEFLVSNNALIIHFAKTLFLHSSDSYPKSICRSLKNKYAAYMT